MILIMRTTNSIWLKLQLTCTPDYRTCCHRNELIHTLSVLTLAWYWRLSQCLLARCETTSISILQFLLPKCPIIVQLNLRQFELEFFAMVNLLFLDFGGGSAGAHHGLQTWANGLILLDGSVGVDETRIAVVCRLDLIVILLMVLLNRCHKCLLSCDGLDRFCHQRAYTILNWKNLLQVTTALILIVIGLSQCFQIQWFGLRRHDI